MNVSPSKRNILVCLAAVLSSEVLMSLMSEMLFRAHPLQPTRVFEELESIRWWQDVGVRPVGALVVGSLVGFLARQGAWQLALFAMLPRLILHFLAKTWEGWTVVLAVAYLGIAISGALTLARWRGQR